MMDEVIPAVVLVLIAAGCFCLGGLWQAVRVQLLREVLTGVEHDRARLEGRPPKSIKVLVAEHRAFMARSGYDPA